MAHVRFSGPGPDVQPFGDLAVRESFRDQRENFALAFGDRLQQVGSRWWRGCGPGGEFPDQPAGDAGGEQCVAGGDDPDGGEQFRRWGVLEQESTGSAAQRSVD